MFLRNLCERVCRALRCLCYRPIYRRRRRVAPIPYRPDPSYVVLQFSEPVAVNEYNPDQTRRLEPTWSVLKERYAGIELLPVFRSVPPDKLKAIYEKEGHGDGKGRAPNFLQYFQIVGPHKAEAFADIAKTLRESKAGQRELQDIYEVHPGPLPQVNTSDPGFGWQDHLSPAPDQFTPFGERGGVGAQAAWARPGSDGGQGANRVRFVDLERGWDLGHPDLPQNPQPPILRGASNPASAGHGTAVLGIVCAQDGNGQGGVGLAPRADVALSAYWETRPNTQQPTLDFDDAIVAAVVNFLQAGDVLLIEAQVYATANPADILMLPVEVHALTFSLISWAVWQRNIIVVEPGGDGSNMQTPALDMDAWAHPVSGLQLLRRAVRDSGALMVSAAQAAFWDATDLQPHLWAPVGDRIDCFAYGDGVYTCWSAAAPSPCQGAGGAVGALYIDCFSGTSAAAAIVAGAAIVLQGISRAGSGGNSIDAGDMRSRLGNRTLGVNTPPSVDPGGNLYRIGVMPNLAVLHLQIP